MLAESRSRKKQEQMAKQRMNPEAVPPELREFVPLVEKWGCVRGDTERLERGWRAEDNAAALEQLRTLAAQWTDEKGAIFAAWVDEHPITESHETAKFYFTLMMLDELDLYPKRQAADPIGDLVKDLGSFGSFRLASRRMHAAGLLPHYGEAAAVAIPELRRAVGDEDGRVRVWAHYALARFTADADEHRTAIDAMLKENSQTDDMGLLNEIGMEAAAALERLARTQAEHDLGALCSFSVLGDTRQLARLVDRVDVNALDHNEQFALEYAVGNGHTDATRLLLEHGADPNQVTHQGDVVLHDAVQWRESQEIIRLLAAHGADLNARDADGGTPLDRAREARRKDNVKLLRQLGAE